MLILLMGLFCKHPQIVGYIVNFNIFDLVIHPRFNTSLKWNQNVNKNLQE